MTAMAITLSAIHIFPLKSCAPLPLAQARVHARGLEHDRRWLLVDEESKFITARKCPKLVLVRAVPIDEGLQLDAPGMPTLRVSFPAATRRTSTVIWDDTVTALAGDDESATWLSRLLEQPCRLVFMDDACARPVDPNRATPGDEVSFADSHPLTLLSASAIDHLNTKLAQPVPALRFRPNLLIDGVEPHAEDEWKRIRIGDVEFELLGPCVRCVFTTLDFHTGSFDAAGEPLRTLAKYRRSPRGVIFSQNLTPRSLGTLRVGDVVEILA
jgi:uncharacterized protein YcbX